MFNESCSDHACCILISNENEYVENIRGTPAAGLAARQGAPPRGRQGRRSSAPAAPWLSPGAVLCEETQSRNAKLCERRVEGLNREDSSRNGKDCSAEACCRPPSCVSLRRLESHHRNYRSCALAREEPFQGVAAANRSRKVLCNTTIGLVKHLQTKHTQPHRSWGPQERKPRLWNQYTQRNKFYKIWIYSGNQTRSRNVIPLLLSTFVLFCSFFWKARTEYCRAECTP